MPVAVNPPPPSSFPFPLPMPVLGALAACCSFRGFKVEDEDVYATMRSCAIMRTYATAVEYVYGCGYQAGPSGDEESSFADSVPVYGVCAVL